jgi:mono/diheme cytochrome c family protein
LTSADAKAILDAVRGVRADIADLKVRVRNIEASGAGKALPPALPPTVPPPAMPKAAEDAVGTSGKEVAVPGGGAVAIFQAKCAGCHEAAVSADKGGGFTMFDGGKLVNLSDRAWGKIGSKVAVGRMPPPKSGIVLSDEDAATVADWLDRRK